MYRSLLKAAAELRRAVLADDWSIVREDQPICDNICNLLEAGYGSEDDVPKPYSTLSVLFRGYPQSRDRHWPVGRADNYDYWFGANGRKRMQLLDYLIEVLNAHPDNNQ